MVVGVTGWELGSLDLRTLAYNIEEVSGWESFPGLRSSGQAWAYRHGEDIGGRRFYNARDIELSMMILDTPADGIITTTRQQHLDENVAALLGALHSSDSYLTLTKTLYPSTERTIAVRPVQVLRFEDGAGGFTRSVQLILRTGYPFWHGAAFTFAGSGAGTFTGLGNAPINDMVITFTAAGRITNNLNGDWVESSTAGVVLDVGSGEVTSGPSSASITTNRPWFIQFEPGANSVSRTASISVAGFHGYF